MYKMHGTGMIKAKGAPAVAIVVVDDKWQW